MLSVLLNRPVKDHTEHILRYYSNAKPPYVSGLEIKASNVYSISPGTVIAVGLKSSKYEVTVLVNDNQIVRYTNLKSINVVEGQNITFSSLVGVADKFVRFEYCTTNKGTGSWPVRIKSLTMYKQDPIGLVTGDIQLTVVVDNVREASGDEEMIPLDKYTLAEFTGSRGEEE